MADVETTTIRRRELGSVALLTMGIMPMMARAGAPHPDDELLALAEEFIELARRVTGLYGDGAFAHLHIDDDKARDAAIDPLRARQYEIQDEMESMRATTPAGLLARVRMLEAWEPGWREAAGDPEDIIVFDLLQDIHALAGRASA